jgi:hypothetical protein
VVDARQADPGSTTGITALVLVESATADSLGLLSWEIGLVEEHGRWVAESVVLR